ncbi:hypothetical protein ACFL5M_02055 [Candidatus Neomarinimicrobiota bacterium]
MKALNLTIIPMTMALVLSGALLATRETSVLKETVSPNFDYVVFWGSNSFDEAVWLVVDEIARFENDLPSQVQQFHVKVQSNDGAFPAVYLDFDRESLERLKTGALSPEAFIRDHVDFS